MPTIFQESIRTAIEDETLQAALDLNARRRYDGRLSAMGTLENPDAARRMAHAVRSDTIANLDRYLEQFTENVQTNGITLHRAANPNEANQIVLDIIHRQGTNLVAKSKSMVTEELGLNHALEDAGIHAVETDLGEYIIQLRKERPSHIITPAVHLTRGQVSDTFENELGTPRTDNIEDLTAVARRELRRVFLAAGVGISGVNFGVAESGTLCIVTNEGNGRMVTSLPPVHIALMGIERLVPSWGDLALMLSLLPRSATGQKITVYVNLMRGPRQPGELDGPGERHLILVDNGRSALRASPLAEALLCIRCGACLNACPIFREIGGHAYVGQSGAETTYPGPIGSIIAPGLFGQDEFGHLARASTLCGACNEACPVDIDLPKLLLRTRVGGRSGETPQGTTPRHFALALKLYTWLATGPRRFQAAQRAAAWLAPLFSPRSEWMRLPAFTGWGMSRQLPRPAKPFSAQYPDSAILRKSESTQWVAGAQTAEPGKQSQDPQPTTFDEQSNRADVADSVERFKEELEALGGTVEVTSADRVGQGIIALLTERGVREVITWGAEQLPAGVLAQLEEIGIDQDQEWGSELEERAAAQTSVGLTGARAGIAETGTLVLTAGSGRPLSTSLLPEVHIAVLWAKDIYKDLAQVLALQDVQEASSSTLISGPSRTADIEMTLTVGVHGPREVIVFCISES